jgi:flagellar hook-associated protein 2
VTLTNGMTLAQIVDALNTEFQTATFRTIEASQALMSDAVGTAATDATLLQDLHDGSGNALGVADGDTMTISGTKSDGTSYYKEFVVTDVTSQTLGDLRAAISDALGTSVDVSVQDGVLTATSLDAGRKTFTLSVSSDNAGGGTFSFGTLDVTEPGHGKASITASDSGGELTLAHADYGSAAGFDVAYTAGGTDGSASLGLAAGSSRGTDAAGTIGGQSATGAGRLLVAATDTTAEGLQVRYTGSSTGSVGSVRFSRGIASLMQLVADAQVDPNTGSLKGVVDALDTQQQGIASRIDDMQKRLDQRQQFLISRFNALEEAMAKAQQQISWLQAQLGSVSNSG